MRKFRLWVIPTLMLLAMGTWIPARGEEEATVELVNKIKPSVVTLLVFNEQDEMISQGSGFFIAENRIATSRHVIESAHHARIKTASGETYDVEGLLGEDELMDVAVLSVKVPKKKYKPMELAKTLPKEGQEIVVIGSPLGLDQTVTKGYVSDICNAQEIGESFKIKLPVLFKFNNYIIINNKGIVVGLSNSKNLMDDINNTCHPSIKINNIKTGKVQTFSERLKDNNFAIEALSGYLKFSDGDYAEAIIQYSKIIDKNPDNYLAYAFLGDCYNELEQYEKAIEKYNKSISLNPDYAKAHFCLGLMYGKIGEYSDSLEAFKNALLLVPDDAMTLYNIGITYSKQNEHNKALEAFKNATDLKPDFADAYYNLGVTYGILGLHKKEIEAYEQATKLNPDFANAYYNLGIAYREIGKHDKAIESLKKAIRLNPDDVDAYYNITETFESRDKKKDTYDSSNQFHQLNRGNFVPNNERLPFNVPPYRIKGSPETNLFNMDSDEISLYDSSGTAIAYIAEDLTLYLWSGKPVAYLDQDISGGFHIYGFNGKHLGWFVGGVIRDHQGYAVGAVYEVFIIPPRFEPFKQFKQFKPFKSFKEFAPFRPFFINTWSDIGLKLFLLQGVRT